MQKLKQAFIKHGLSVGILLAAILIYFYPTFDGKMIKMDDIERSLSTSKELRDYRETTGDEPLWTNGQFAGMPAFQMNTEYPSNIYKHLEKPTKLYMFQLGLIIALALGFYFLLISFNVDPWLSIVGALAFAFSTYFVLSLAAGHTGKLRATGYLAPVLMSVFLVFRKKYILGGVLALLSIGMAISANHLQITYYLAIACLVAAIVETIYAFKEKNTSHLLKAGGVLMLAAILSVGPNISQLWTTNSYTTESTRGGSSELTPLTDNVEEEKKSEGLDWDYAMNWSYGKAETFNLLIADLYGGGRADLTDNKEYMKALTKECKKVGYPKKVAKDLASASPTYWGSQDFTSGPNYIGAAVIFLFVLGLLIVKGRVKWFIAIATGLFIMLAWGENFAWFNKLWFEYFPVYNKFRAPSMILTMVCLTIPFLGILAANEVIKSENRKEFLPKINMAFYITGGLTLLVILVGMSTFSFEGIKVDGSNGDEGTVAQYMQYYKMNFPLEALWDARSSLFLNSALKSLLLITGAYLLFRFFSNNKLSKPVLIAGIGLLVVGDLWYEGSKMLNSNNYIDKEEFYSNFEDKAIDKAIKSDAGDDLYYRVFDANGSFQQYAPTSISHKSLSGYHGAKLRRYQDLIERHLNKGNQQVMNMLNHKYTIFSDQKMAQQLDANPTAQLPPGLFHGVETVKQPGGKKQRVHKFAQKNPNGYGNAWFVNELKIVDNADQESDALDSLDLKTQAVADKKFESKINKDFSNSGSNTIKLTSYKPNELVFATEIKDANTLTVFSDIYYEGSGSDWQAYIDGNPVDHFRVDYLLRGLNIPNGAKEVIFKFEPLSYFKGESYAFMFSILVVLLVLAGIGYEVKNYLKAA